MGAVGEVMSDLPKAMPGKARRPALNYATPARKPPFSRLSIAACALAAISGWAGVLLSENRWVTSDPAFLILRALPVASAFILTVIAEGYVAKDVARGRRFIAMAFRLTLFWTLCLFFAAPI